MELFLECDFFLTKVHYKIISKTDGAYYLNGKLENSRLHRVKSKKGGNDSDSFLKHFFEIADTITLPLGFVEANCEYLLRHYYSSNGKEGWSPIEVENFLLKLGRSKKFVEKFLIKIKQSMEEK